MNRAKSAVSARRIRIAGYLAMLYGFVGAFAGISGTATFIPYRIQNMQTLETAEVVTAISALGAILSVLGLVSGWQLLRGKGWAWRGNLCAASGCVATVAAFAVVTPPSTPSPVPGGPSAYVFLAAVAAAYGLEVVFLLLGRKPHRTGTAAARGSSASAEGMQTARAGRER